jgi:hypothetical protein
LTITWGSQGNRFETYAEGRMGFSGPDTFTFDNVFVEHGSSNKMFMMAGKSNEKWKIRIVNPLIQSQSVVIFFDFVGAHEFLKPFEK